jgi:predicted peptidase
MTYALLINAIQVGPFTTHIAATVFAEQNGFDDYTMVELYDPAEAPGLIHRLFQPLLAVTPRSQL